MSRFFLTWLSIAFVVVGCTSNHATRSNPGSDTLTVADAPTAPTATARTNAQPKLVEVPTVSAKPVETVAYRQDHAIPVTAVPIEAKPDPVALLGTENDVIPAVVSPWRQNRATRIRLVKSTGQYPLLRREEILRREGDRVIVQSVQEMVADHFMVSLQPGQDPATVIAASGCTVRRVLPGGRVALAAFAYESHDDYNTTQNRLKSVPAIRSTDQDFVVKAIGTPADPSYGELWGMHNEGQKGGLIDADIDAPEAWNLSTGSKSVLVGVIDTGIDRSHPDLSDNMWTNPGESGTDVGGQDKRFNGVDDDNNGYVDDWRGWDFVNGDNDPHDDHLHGTHCAGTIGATGNNGIGVAGVCWNVSLVGLKFLSAGGSGVTSGAVEATLYANTIGCTLTSNSWGGGGYSQALKDAIDAAGAAGKLFVAAAGNNGSDTDIGINYPSGYDSPNIISVAATDRYDSMAYFSNYGLTSVDLGAPGVDVYSTTPGSSYQILSGTSMATPHVAGACALIKSANSSLTDTQIKQVLLSTVDPIPSLAGKTVTGGRLNLFSAVQQVSGPVLTVVSKVMVDGGNKNGILNPGEIGNLTVTISSNGSEGLSDIVGTLTLSHPAISIIDGSVTYGAVPTGSTSVGDSPFQIQIASSAVTPLTVEGLITFNGSVGGPWSTPVTVSVYKSALLYGTVKTKAGQPIPNATVTWAGAASGSATTNSVGFYKAPLIVGSYQVSASAPTYGTSAPQTVTLPPNKAVSFVLGKPDIVVTPAALSLESLENQGAIGTLTISNTGDSTLTGSLSQPVTWTASGLWHESTYRSVDGSSWYYGQESTRNYDTGSANSGALETTLSVPANDPTLTFREWRQTESGYNWDLSQVQVSPIGSGNVVGIHAWTTVYQSSWQGDWHDVAVNLSAYAGQKIALRFFFNTVDHIANHYEGWYVDDVKLGGTSLGNWLMTTPSNFTVEAGQSTSVTVTTLPLPGGVHQSSILVTSNDPDEPNLSIPVTFTSLGSPYLKAVNPVWADNVSPAVGDGDGWLEPGETVSLWLTVRNTGSAPAMNVTGLIATENPNLTILSGTLQITDLIPPGGQVISGPYVVSINAGHAVPADVDVFFNGYVNNTNAWASSVPLHVDSRSTVSGVVKNGTDAPISDVLIQVNGVNSAISGSDGTYFVTGLPAGSHNLSASKSGFISVLTTVIVPGNATWNPILGSREFTLTPSSLNVQMTKNQSVTKTVALKSTGTLPVTWSIYPSYYWLTITPTNGTTAPGATDNINLTFSSAGLPYGTYNAWVSIYSDATGGSSSAIQAKMEVASANPPVANPLTVSGEEDTAIPFTLVGTDADRSTVPYRLRIGGIRRK
jgi:subtilisin family serine protease